MRILVINPGSTSTMEYPTTNDQLPFRKGVVLDLLQEHGVDIASIDVFVGRGGCAYSQSEGVMVIDERLVKDTMDDVGGSDHPAKLGVMMAYDFGKRYGKPMYTVDPTNVDELAPPARITGLKGVYRRAQSHVLNQKGIARIHAAKMGRRYEECSFIVCHIDGGITIAAHERGRMVDGTEGAGGDGPFTPTRLGGIPVMEVARYLETHEPSDLEAMCSRSGGFVSHFATSSADRVHEMKEKGDEHATLVWDAMVYQIAKAIGSMACVLSGKVDAILLTGGLVRFDDIVEGIRSRCGWIAPIEVDPGEVEQEAMCSSVMKVLSGEAEAHVYTGRPVFGGFGWE